MQDIREGRGGWPEIAELLKQLRYLDADASMAGVIMGMLSPWLPTLRDTPAGTPAAIRKEALGIKGLDDILPGTGLSGSDGEYRWPSLEDSIEWIVDNRVAGRDALQSLHRDLRRRAFSDDLTPKLLTTLQNALAESLVAGDSVDQFRERIQDITSVSRSQSETILRTNTKQAYLYGQERTLDQPGVKDRFRWVYYAATKDNRSRAHHAALDGWVAERGSDLHRIMLRVQSQFNCRCSLIPCDQKRADEFGVKTAADIPAIVRAAA